MNEKLSANYIEGMRSRRGRGSHEKRVLHHVLSFGIQIKFISISEFN